MKFAISCVLVVATLHAVAGAALEPRGPRTETAWQRATIDAKAAGRRLLHLQPLSKNGETVCWAALMGRTSPVSTNTPFPQVGEVTLNLYGDENGQVHCLSKQGPLLDPRFDRDPAVSVGLECPDLNGDGSTDVVVTETHPGASWQPSCAFVFYLSKTNLVLAGTLTSHDPIHAVPRNDGGGFLLPITYAIGQTLPHFAQPRWTDFYAFAGDRLVLANQRCAQSFQGWPAKLRKLLEEHPRDAELWFFLGRCRAALGKELEAKSAFAQAKSLGYEEPDWNMLRAGLQTAVDATSPGLQRGP